MCSWTGRLQQRPFIFVVFAETVVLRRSDDLTQRGGTGLISGALTWLSSCSALGNSSLISLVREAALESAAGPLMLLEGGKESIGMPRIVRL